LKKEKLGGHQLKKMDKNEFKYFHYNIREKRVIYHLFLFIVDKILKNYISLRI